MAELPPAVSPDPMAHRRGAAPMGPLLAAALLLALLGCGAPEARLTFWVGGAPQEVDYWEELVAEFAADTGLVVEVIRQPAATEQRKQGLVMALAAGQPDPDLFLMDIVWLPQFAASGWLEPLDRFFRDDGLGPADFFPQVVERVDRHAGRTVALPAFLDVGLLYYRRDLLARHGFDGPPATWSTLVAQAEAIQAAERPGNPNFHGFVWQGAQYEGLVCTFLEFAASHGGGFQSGGRIDLTRPGNREALQFMLDLVRRWRISPPNTYTEMREEQVRRSFQRGNALFERNWLYAGGLHRQPGSAVRGRVAQAPLPHAPGASPAATLGGWHLGISRRADAPEAAWRLAAFLLSRETQTKLLLRLGWYSGRPDVYSDPEVRRRVPQADALGEIVAHAVNRPALPYYDLVSRIVQRYVNDCLAGKRTPDQALAAAQREVARLARIYEEP